MWKGLGLQAQAYILGYVMGLSLQKADSEMEIGVQEASLGVLWEWKGGKGRSFS